MNLAVLVMGTNRLREVDILVSSLISEPYRIIHTGQETVQLMRNRSEWPAIQTSLINKEFIIVSSKHSSNLSFYKDTIQTFSARLPANTVSIKYINRERIVINTRAGIQSLKIMASEGRQLNNIKPNITSSINPGE